MLRLRSFAGEIRFRRRRPLAHRERRLETLLRGIELGVRARELGARFREHGFRLPATERRVVVDELRDRVAGRDGVRLAHEHLAHDTGRQRADADRERLGLDPTGGLHHDLSRRCGRLAASGERCRPHDLDCDRSAEPVAEARGQHNQETAEEQQRQRDDEPTTARRPHFRGGRGSRERLQIDVRIGLAHRSASDVASASSPGSGRGSGPITSWSSSQASTTC